MEAFPPEPPRLELLDPAAPGTPPSLKHILPLRIVKRSDSSCGGHRDNIADQAPRRCSQETDESRGSAPDLLCGQKQLTIPKIRGHRNSQVFGSLDELDGTPVPLSREPYLPNSMWYRPTAPDYALTTLDSILET